MERRRKDRDRLQEPPVLAERLFLYSATTHVKYPSNPEPKKFKSLSLELNARDDGREVVN